MGLTFQELRARLPREVSDAVVRLIATSEEALLDFAKLRNTRRHSFIQSEISIGFTTTITGGVT